jgi:hypothetical protein
MDSASNNTKTKTAAPKTYTCLDPVLHNGHRYAPGDDIDLDQDVAARLVERGVLEEKVARKK